MDSAAWCDLTVLKESLYTAIKNNKGWEPDEQ